MISEARKLYVIEEVLKIKSESTLAAIEAFIHKAKKKTKMEDTAESLFAEFFGIWTKEEADDIKQKIEESCETIDPNDWK